MYLHIFQDKGVEDVGKIKSTVMLCYGYLTLYAPTDIIPSRVEANILKNINPHFKNVKVCMTLHVFYRSTDEDQGRIQDFHLGGAQKIICANAHHEREIRSPFRQGSRARLTLIPLGYFEDLSPLGGGGGGADLAPPQISATNGPINSKIGTVVKQVK